MSIHGRARFFGKGRGWPAGFINTFLALTDEHIKGQNARGCCGCPSLLSTPMCVGIVPDRHGCGLAEVYQAVFATRPGHLCET